jgi:hypothetical protein
MSQLIPGTRVLITRSKDFVLATVVKTEGDECLISLDNRDFKKTNFITLDAKHLLPVNYWKLQTARTDYDSLKHMEYDPHTIFLSKKNIAFDMAAVRAMFCWTRYKLYNYRLDYPVLQSKVPRLPEFKGGTLYGLFQSQPVETISLNMPKIISMNMCFSILVHETVHQVTYEDHQPVDHGPYFFAWKERVESICKVPLTKESDLSYKEVEYTPEDLNEEDKPFYVLMLLQGSVYKAVASKDLEILEALRDMFTMGYTTYLRKIKNRNLRNILTFLTKVPTNGKTKAWIELPEELSTLIIDKGQTVYSKQLSFDVGTKCC